MTIAMLSKCNQTMEKRTCESEEGLVLDLGSGEGADKVGSVTAEGEALSALPRPIKTVQPLVHPYVAELSRHFPF